MNPQLIGLTIDTAGAFAMMGLALWVWRVRPESRVNRSFALLVSTIAAAVLFVNLAWMFFYIGRPDALARDVFSMLSGLGLVAAAVLTLRFATLFTRGADASTFRVGQVAGATVAGLHLVLSTLINGDAFVAFYRSHPLMVTIAQSIGIVGIIIYTTAVYYLLVRLAFAYRNADIVTSAERWRIAAVAIAFAAWPLYAEAAAAVSGPGAETVASPIQLLIVITLASAAWIWAASGNGGRLASTIAVSIMAISLAGAVASARYGWDIAINSGAIGALRFGGTLLLAYAVLRHQLFEIDLKLKWTISRGTVAGSVLVTFFVVSQLVENLASEKFGLLAGSFAAGFLLFLIQPLLRFADRVADRAMPNVQDTEQYRTVRKRDVYVAALEGALVDGVVSDRERDMLARLQDQLGLTATEARALERVMAEDRPLSG